MSFKSTKLKLVSLQERFPTEVKHGLMCLRRRRIWRATGVVFIHIPKAAGTSVSHALYGRSIGHMTARQVRRYCPDLFASLPSFAIARNPWDRLASAYDFLRLGGTTDAGVYQPERYKATSFRTFDSFVLEWLPSQKLEQLDYVLQTQSSFVVDEAGRVLMDFIGKMEDLAKVEESLGEILGRTIVFPHKNPSRQRGGYRDLYVSKRMINTVGDIYSSDVALFDYEF